MWRHGDRNQIMQLPTDTGNSESTWPQGFGELTKVVTQEKNGCINNYWLEYFQEGMRQHFILGNFLKRRYKKYLSEQYNSSKVQNFTENKDRIQFKFFCRFMSEAPTTIVL